MVKHTPISDEIYRAAIETAGHLGTPLEAGTALRALAYELELRGLDIDMPADDAPRGALDLLMVDGSDGVCVTVGAGRGTEFDLGGMLRQHGWTRAHEIAFGDDSLHIKTIVG